MRRLVLAAIAMTSIPASGSPSEDDRDSRVSRVDGELVGPRARFVVRHSIFVEAKRPGHVADLDMPLEGVAIGATVVMPDGRHPLELLPSELASERFDEMLERRAGRARRSVVLVEHSRHGLSIDAAMPVTGRVTLEVELELPTCYARDLRHALVPGEWASVLAPTLRRSDASGFTHDELVDICGRDATDHVWLAFASPPPAPMLAYAGRLAAGSDMAATHYARLELAVASELGTIPQDLVTAIVVDGSRSMTPAQRLTQDALVAAYLRAAPESRAQIVAFARHAKALSTNWVSASDAKNVLAALRAVVPQNGSNIDAGLVEAARQLGRVSGTKRVLLVGDSRLASRIGSQIATLGKLLPAGTLVHVAAVTGHDSEPYRDDDEALAPFATQTGGMSIVTGSPAAGLDAKLLVRPISLDNIVVTGGGWKSQQRCAEEIAEGRGCVWWGTGDARAGAITLEAMLWGKRITQVIRPDARQATMLARELSAEEPRFAAADSEEIDVAARAVNDRWSLLGSWGGRSGYRDRTRGHTHPYHSSRTPHGSYLSGTGTRGLKPAVTIDLAPQLRASVATCRPNRPVTAHLETTLSEIVAVSVQLGGAALAPADHARLVSCIEEAIWATHVTVPSTFPAGRSTAHF